MPDSPRIQQGEGGSKKGETRANRLAGKRQGLGASVGWYSRPTKEPTKNYGGHLALVRSNEETIYGGSVTQATKVQVTQKQKNKRLGVGHEPITKKQPELGGILAFTQRAENKSKRLRGYNLEEGLGGQANKGKVKDERAKSSLPQRILFQQTASLGPESESTVVQGGRSGLRVYDDQRIPEEDDYEGRSDGSWTLSTKNKHKEEQTEAARQINNNKGKENESEGGDPKSEYGGIKPEARGTVDGEQLAKELREEKRYGLKVGFMELEENREAMWREEPEIEEADKGIHGRECLSATLDRGGLVWILNVKVGGELLEALVDTGASRSFVHPSVATAVQWRTEDLERAATFQVASGHEIVVRSVVKQAAFSVGSLSTLADLLVAHTPYEMVLGTDWLRREAIVWDFGQCRILRAHGGRMVELPAKAREGLGKQVSNPEQAKDRQNEERQLAEEAREQMQKGIEALGEDAAAALVRPAPKRYKNYKKRGALVPIKRLLEDLKLQAKGEVKIKENIPLMGMQLVPADPFVGRGAEPNSDPTEVTLEEGTITRSMDRDELDFKGEVAETIPEESIKTVNIEGLVGQDVESKEECAAIVEYEGPTYTKLEEWLEGVGRGCPETIKQVICKYRKLFMDKLPPGLPPERVVSHTITLIPGKLPRKGVVYRLGPEELEAQREIIKQLKEAKWITMTSSPFAAPSMLVRKKDDGSGKKQYRMVVNYQELNAITVAPEYPLPTIQEILDMLHGAKVFTTIDMEQGFHQIRVDPKDQYKTAFRTCMGQYEFKVMPFGLRGAPGTFQAVMNHMFFDYLGKGVIAYLDDLLVYSPDVESHARLLDKVLSTLQENKMYPKIAKCNFGATAIEYLGYRVGAEGITPSRDKIKAIEIWPEKLENDTQVKQFLGTINYCRMFMGPAFAELARPLVELTKKDAAFNWTEEHTTAVKRLKEQLINYVTLQVPDPNKPYVLKTDASGYAVGAVLEQDNKPIGFLSKKMSPTELRYATYDQELLALIRALEKWRRLLLTADVTVYTDHRALQYLQQLKGDKPVRGRVARWLVFLADFQNIKIKYHPGVGNIVADALSRNPCHQAIEDKTYQEDSSGTSPAATEVMLSLQEHIDKQQQPQGVYKKVKVPEITKEEEPIWKLRVGGPWWMRALLECPDFADTFKQAQQQPGVSITADLKGARHEFKLEGHLLYIKLQGLWRICVPDDKACKQYIMYQFHDHPTAGHMGIRKTYDALARLYFWPGIRAYAKTYVESCTRCRAAKTISAKPGGLLQSLQIPNRRWAHVSLDFITGLPLTVRQHDAILTMVDSLSKMAHFVPTTTTASAADVVALLADRLVRYHGLPSVLISDRDPRFVAEVWELFCKRFAIKRALSSSWHPQTDGQTERVHRTLEQVLRTYIQSDETAWEDLLPATELAYNCTVHNSTGLTPFEVMIGENPLRASDLDLVDELEPTTTPPMTKLFQQLVDRAAAHIAIAQAQQQHYANNKRRHVEFKVGDEVWVSTRFMQPRGVAKFQQRFIGPFKVLARVGKVAYRLALPPSMLQHPVFHVSLLQQHIARPSHMRQVEGWDPVVAAAEGEDATYEVEHILDVRGEGPQQEYLVQWKGYPKEAASWEPLENLTGCKDLLRAFRASKTRQQRRELPRSGLRKKGYNKG